MIITHLKLELNQEVVLLTMKTLITLTKLVPSQILAFNLRNRNNSIKLVFNLGNSNNFFKTCTESKIILIKWENTKNSY